MSPLAAEMNSLRLANTSGLLTSKGKQTAVRSNVHHIFDKSRRRGDFLAENISSQHLQLFGARIDHGNRARLRREVNVAIRSDGRSCITSANSQALLVQHSSR